MERGPGAQIYPPVAVQNTVKDNGLFERTEHRRFSKWGDNKNAIKNLRLLFSFCL